MQHRAPPLLEGAVTADVLVHLLDYEQKFDEALLVGQFSSMVGKLSSKIEQLVAYFDAKSAENLPLCQRVFREQGGGDDVNLMQDISYI